MNRFKNKLPIEADPQFRDAIMSAWWASGNRPTPANVPNPIYGLAWMADEDSGRQYQDLYDQLADDYRGGYHGDRKTKLLLYIEHRAMRDYGVVIHTGTGFSRFDTEDTHHGNPAVIAGLCEDYDSCEREEVQEYLVGIR